MKYQLPCVKRPVAKTLILPIIAGSLFRTNGIFILIASFGFLAPVVAAPEVDARTVSIVVGSKKDWANRHAGKELAAYLGRMLPTSKFVILKDDETLPAKSGPVIVVGGPLINTLTRRLEDKGRLGFFRALPAPEGNNPFAQEIYRSSFMIKSVSENGRTFLVLAGVTGHATMYAVYHYLDYVCGVGFFEDGERVPKMKSLPTNGLSIVEVPRFAERIQFAWPIRCLLKKSVSLLWRADVEWKEYIDFLAKNKCNWMRMDIGDSFHLGYGLYVHTFPGTERPDSGFCAKWWPPEYVYNNTRAAVAYARKAGIKLWADAFCLSIPTTDREIIRKEFPDVVFSKVDPVYPYTVYIRDDKTNVAFYRKSLKALFDYCGKPDMYWGKFPVFEEEVVAEFSSKWDPERFNLMAKVVQEFDPSAKFLLDGWLVQMRFSDKPKDLQKLLGKLKCPLVVNTSYPFKPTYRKFDYFYGYPWHYTEIDGFGGQDFFGLYVPYPELLARAKDIITRKGSRCVGFGSISELIGRDPMMRYFYMRLSWNPFKYKEWTDVLSEYTRKRYGEASYDNMYKSGRLLAQALFDNRLHINPYIAGYEPVYRKDMYLAFPMVQKWWKLYADGKSLKILENSLLSALKEKDRLKGDALYEKYLAGLFHTYANELFKLSLLRCYSAYYNATQCFLEGLTEGPEVQKYLDLFETEAAKVDLALGQIEKVWSTRPELSTAKEAKEAMLVPGASSQLIETIRRDSLIYEEGAYEGMAQVYRPRVNIIVDDLRKRLARREKQLFSGPVAPAATPANWKKVSAKYYAIPTWFDDSVVRPRIEALYEKYIKEEPAKRKFTGTTTDAVVSAVNKLHKAGSSAGGFSDMMTHRKTGKNYPLISKRTTISNPGFEQGFFGLWEVENGGKNLRGEVSTAKAASGKYALRLKGIGDDSFGIYQGLNIAGKFGMEAKYFLSELPAGGAAANLSFIIDGYDAQEKHKLHAVYWTGTDNWDFGNATPDKIKRSFYSTKVKLSPKVGEWISVNIDPFTDVNRIHGEGVYEKLKLVHIKVTVMAWSAAKEADKVLDVFVDDIKVQAR